MKRTTAVALLVAGLAGCPAGTRFSGQIDVGQWTPKFKGSALKDGGSNFDLVSNGGVGSDEDLWAFEATFGLQTASSNQIKPYRLNLGFWRNTYAGTGPATGLTFAGATFAGDASTTADLAYYKLTYEEPDVSRAPQPGGTGSVTAGFLGLHYLDFSVIADDGLGNRGVFEDGAPMFVLGYRIEQYAKGGLVYYASVEGMDLDTLSLGGVEGSVMDASGGMRWFIRGQKAAISVGYRTIDASLKMGANRLNLDMDGATFSFFMRW